MRDWNPLARALDDRNARPARAFVGRTFHIPTMDRARNNLAGQNEGDGAGGGGVRWIVYATSSRKITRVMGQQGVGYDG